MMTINRGCWAIDLSIARLLYFTSSQEREMWVKVERQRYDKIPASHSWVTSMYNAFNHKGKEYVMEEFMSPLSPALPPVLR